MPDFDFETTTEWDVAAGRLDADAIARNFGDIAPPMRPADALVEASRCYFCHDAPCVDACPTGIDIPGFIRKISTGNMRGSALRILEANIFGGACARVCPTEILCEGACVRLGDSERAVQIGALQRHATDWLMAREQTPFAREKLTGKRIAVVGAGPAGLSCAHRLSMRGHDVVVFDAKEKPGGLNEYGIAAYKVPDEFARDEVAFILAIGGIELRLGTRIGDAITLDTLRQDFEAVFLGLGQTAVRALGIEGETFGGVRDAVDFIAELRQHPKDSILVGRRVVVIGGGNTAIDAATQSRRLGAEDVTIVYRRGPETMSATSVEQEWAQTNNVQIRHWSAPLRLIETAGHVSGIEFARTRADAAGRAIPAGGSYTLRADMVLKAVGQQFDAGGLALATEDGRIAVDAERRTAIPGVWAGGDCIAGIDLTVAAVEDGKQAAESISRTLLQAANGMEAANG